MPGNRIARTAVGTATATTFHQAMPNHATSTAPSPAAAAAVIAHFTDQIACQAPVDTSGRPQFANTRMATIAKKNTAFCHSGRLTSGSGMSAHAAALACSSFLKIRCIESPITTLKTTAPTVRAMPISRPRIRAVNAMASTLMAGPEYRKAVAGPMPAPIR